MRKIILSIFTILIILLGVTMYFSLNRSESLDLFVIKQNKSYVYRDNLELSFEIYSYKKSPLITYIDENEYHILYDDFILTLDDIKIAEYKQNDVYLIKIESRMPEVFKDGIDIKDLRLEIKNIKYTFMANMGCLSILNPIDYELLSIQSLYASYSYINKSLMLVGINIVFTNEYKTLKSFKIGGYTEGILCLSLKNSAYDNEIEIKNILPSYSPTFFSTEFLNLESKSYFIPISYKELNVIKEGYITLNLDDKLYYLDTFSFISNELIFDDYKSIVKKADINYA